jgi:uncharacterized protein YndB with AHSA1/START domain
MTRSRALELSTPTDTDIVLTRRFAAQQHLVFDAWTQPELLRRWYGARGWNLVVCEVDLRVGGIWRFVSRGPGGEEMGQRGVYQEIVRPDRLVYTEVFDDQSYPGQTLVTHGFADDGDGGTRLTSTITYPSRAVRDHVLRRPMERGLSEGLARLDEVLARILRPQ